MLERKVLHLDKRFSSLHTLSASGTNSAQKGATMNYTKIMKVLLIAIVVVLAAASASAWPIKQACTPGFFKNHPEFITGGSCATVNQDTLVSSVYSSVEPGSCVGNLSLLELLSSPTTVCGKGNTLEGAEVILLRQSITRALNGTNSFDACHAVRSVINTTNVAIENAIATGDLSGVKALADKYSALNNDNPCTIGQ